MKFWHLQWKNVLKEIVSQKIARVQFTLINVVPDISRAKNRPAKKHVSFRNSKNKKLKQIVHKLPVGSGIVLARRELGRNFGRKFGSLGNFDYYFSEPLKTGDLVVYLPLLQRGIRIRYQQ